MTLIILPEWIQKIPLGHYSYPKFSLLENPVVGRGHARELSCELFIPAMLLNYAQWLD